MDNDAATKNQQPSWIPEQKSDSIKSSRISNDNTEKDDESIFNELYRFESKICLLFIDEIRQQHPDYPSYLLYFYKLFIYTRSS